MKKVIPICVVLALLLVLMTGCGEKNQSGDIPGGVESTTLPPVQVDMEEYELTYAGEMKDLILTRQTQEGLTFLVKLSQGEYPIFTLRFNVLEGELVTMLTAESGEQVPVSFAMEEIPAGLSAEDELTFCLAQEQVNEIIASLKLK